jgi:hypothetical protein
MNGNGQGLRTKRETVRHVQRELVEHRKLMTEQARMEGEKHEGVMKLMLKYCGERRRALDMLKVILSVEPDCKIRGEIEAFLAEVDK